MASIGSTNALSNVSNAAQVAPTAKAAPAASTEQASSATLKEDTVKLSVAAQAKLMHQQGKSPALIAASLGVKVAAVDGYLGIKAAAPVAAETTVSKTPTESAPLSTPAPKTEAPEAPEARAPSTPTAQPVAQASAQPVETQTPTAKS